jgi:hypothetical protein
MMGSGNWAGIDQFLSFPFLSDGFFLLLSRWFSTLVTSVVILRYCTQEELSPSRMADKLAVTPKTDVPLA